MNRLSTTIISLSFVFSLNSIAKNPTFTPPASDRIKINIDKDWLFINRDFPAEEETHQVNQLPWQQVDLPHDWSIEGPFDPENNTTQGFLPMNIGWYRKGLRFPDSYEGKKIFIIFDGVYRASDVWMNYHHLGHHESGYTSFMYDVTDFVRTGNRIPNGLRVRADGRRHEEDMYEGNGIYRHVWLLVTNRLHLDYWGIFISTPEVSKSLATIKVQTMVKNETDRSKKCRLVTKIVDAQGNAVVEMSSRQRILAGREHKFTQTVKLNNPHLWDLDNPYLYKAYSIVYAGDEAVDVQETTFGIRSFHFDPDRGFFLNGENVKIKGFNAHYDFAGLGTAIPDRIHWNAMMAMKRAGFNFYRSCHNPATPERLEVCDQIGMLVWDEIERKLESMEIELPLVRETITRDRNHPSVILWSLENESPLESTVYGTEILKAATKLAHELDPTRPTTFAASMPVNKNGYGDAVDVVCYNYHWRRADEDHLQFPHWKIGGLSEFSAARGRRGVYGVEHFQRAQEDSYFDLYNGMVQTMYEMCARVEEYWRRIKARAYMAGGWIWSGMDYWGEGNAWPLVERGDGTVDLCLFPKDVYYYFVSQWTEEPMLHIFPHWSWPRKRGQVIDVWCYSNCDSVELFVNDRSLGIQPKPTEPELWQPGKSDDIQPEHLSWKVPYKKGTLRAVGYRDNQMACSTEVRTAGKPARIELNRLMTQFVNQSDIPPLVADGRDIVVIKAAVVDQNGSLVPTADNLINFQVKGEEKIIGVGNGDIASHEPNKVSYRKAYNGLCAAIVQSTTTSNEFSVIATSPGLRSGKITITSVPPEPVAIVLDAQPLQVTRSQESQLTATICDKFGETVTSANAAITFEIAGTAVFADGAKTTKVQAQEGTALVKIEAQKPGTVVVKVAGGDLKPGKLKLKISK